MITIGTAVDRDFKLEVFLPIDFKESVKKSKDDEEGKKHRYICGFASTGSKDLQGDTILPSGINIDYFVKHGWINYEHNNDAEFIIGVPTENCYVDPEKGLYVEAMLLDNNKYAEDMWNLAEAIHKSGVNRKLGFSIEGGGKRSKIDPGVIEGIVITNVALTVRPVNTEATWEHFMKSWTTGSGISPETQVDAGALRKESLASAITTLSSALKIKDDKERSELWKSTVQMLDESDRTSEEIAIVVLQLSRGLSYLDAFKYLKESKGGH